MLLRRSFALYGVKPGTEFAGTIQFVVASHGPGTQWLVRQQVGSKLDLVGPLGVPFPIPREPVPAVLVGGGYGSAPLLPLGRAAAGARQRRHDDSRRGHGRPVVRRVGGQATDRRSHRDHRRRVGRPARPGHRTVAVGDRTAGRSGRLRLRPDADAASGRRGSPSACHSGSGRGRGVDGLWHRGVHDLRAAGDRRRRGVASSSGPASRGRCSTPAGCAGPTWVRCRLICTAPMGWGTDGLLDLAGLVAAAEPILTASGCAAAGRELGQFFDISEIRCGRHQVDHAATALGPSDAADGRDAERHAELDRAAGAGHRLLPGARSALAEGAWRSHGGLDRRRSHRRVRGPGQTVVQPQGRPDRGQHLLSERGEPGPGVRLRPAGGLPGHLRRPSGGAPEHSGVRQAVAGRDRHRTDCPSGGRRRRRRYLADQHLARSW